MTSMPWILRTARAPARVFLRQRKMPPTSRSMCTPPPQAGTTSETITSGDGTSSPMDPAVSFPHSLTGRTDRLYSGVDIELRAHQVRHATAL